MSRSSGPAVLATGPEDQLTSSVTSPISNRTLTNRLRGRAAREDVFRRAVAFLSPVVTDVLEEVGRTYADDADPITFDLASDESGLTATWSLGWPAQRAARRRSSARGSARGSADSYLGDLPARLDSRPSARRSRRTLAAADHDASRRRAPTRRHLGDRRSRAPRVDLHGGTAMGPTRQGRSRRCRLAPHAGRPAGRTASGRASRERDVHPRHPCRIDDGSGGICGPRLRRHRPRARGPDT